MFLFQMHKANPTWQKTSARMELQTLRKTQKFQNSDHLPRNCQWLTLFLAFLIKKQNFSFLLTSRSRFYKCKEHLCYFWLHLVSEPHAIKERNLIEASFFWETVLKDHNSVAVILAKVSPSCLRLIQSFHFQDNSYSNERKLQSFLIPSSSKPVADCVLWGSRKK